MESWLSKSPCGSMRPGLTRRCCCFYWSVAKSCLTLQPITLSCPPLSPGVFFFFYFYYFTILYWFCHTSTWIHHGCTHVPHPEPPTHLPPRTIPLGHPSVPPPSILYRVCSDSCPLSQWCYLNISSSIIPFFFFLQSFPASGTFPKSWLFASSGQSIWTSVLASILPMSIQAWFPLELTDLISLLSKGLSRVFFNTTIWKPWFFGIQLSLWSNSHIHTWLRAKP